MPRLSLPALTVHVATVNHRHGENFYCAADSDALAAQLAAYCIEWWGERVDESVESYEGLSDQAILDAYFENNDRESYTTGEAQLVSTLGASSPFADLIAAAQTLADLVEEALHVHIYDVDDTPPADCNYGLGLAAWKSIVPPAPDAAS